MESAAAMDELLDLVDWQPTGEVPGGDELYCTHSGVLKMAGVELRVYQLNDGQRVFDADDVIRFFEGD